jgi:hypothetical protein
MHYLPLCCGKITGRASTLPRSLYIFGYSTGRNPAVKDARQATADRAPSERLRWAQKLIAEEITLKRPAIRTSLGKIPVR